jgi:pilus assembly protein CpaF
LRASNALRQQIRRAVAKRLDPAVSDIALSDLEHAHPETVSRVRRLVERVVAEHQHAGDNGVGALLSDADAAALVAWIMDWQFGAGPLEPLFRIDDVEDIVINTTGTQADSRLDVWTFRRGGKHREEIALTQDELRELLNRQAATQGRSLTPSTPILNARARNGARINAVMPPVSDLGICATIRVHRLVARRFQDLVDLGTLTPAAASWLYLCVRAGLAMIVAGGTSSGKTNFLNACLRLLDPRWRVVLIEDTRELELTAPDHVPLTTIDHADGSRMISQRQLLANALRMRPDRIVLGEARDGAAWDAVKAANTGHEGTMLSIHADDAEQALTRLLQLCGEAPETGNLPEHRLREIAASAFQCVVHIERRYGPDGVCERRVRRINEVNGHVADGVINQRPIFDTGADGALVWTRGFPHERVKRRMHQAGFDDRQIHDALSGAWRPWEAV